MNFRRRSKHNSSRLTSRKLTDVLPLVLKQINSSFSDRPDLILAAWPSIIGEKLSPMTEAVSFEAGVLKVLVKNSTLYSLLNGAEKDRLASSLRSKFPSVAIKTILFRIG